MCDLFEFLQFISTILTLRLFSEEGPFIDLPYLDTIFAEHAVTTQRLQDDSRSTQWKFSQLFE